LHQPIVIVPLILEAAISLQVIVIIAHVIWGIANAPEPERRSENAEAIDKKGLSEVIVLKEEPPLEPPLPMNSTSLSKQSFFSNLQRI